MRLKLLLLNLLAVLLSSCASTKKISYFQDLPEGHTGQTQAYSPITLQPEDKVSILVNSKDPELANLFNLPVVSRYLGTNSAGGTASMQGGISGYTVNSEGDIDFPVLGSVRVAGLRREEIGALIKDELISRNLIKDPVVTVEFMNLTVSVLGEVNKPGRYNIDKDRITLLEAIGMAGDLSIYGKRDNVTVIRQENGTESVYRIDISSGKDLYSSPVYYLKQNDVIYVEPNSMRARQSTVNGNNVRSASFWMSLASLLTTITVLLVK
jgi:polysaccharide export outer membrane protein